jgi:hypothetical protein
MEEMNLITPAVAGAAGALVKELANKGVDWLIALVASHSPAVKEKARQNLQNFVYRLAKRVELLEAELPPSQKDVFSGALDQPDLSLLIQKCLVSAAATDNDDRHSILSELIAQRLTADADDMIALVGGAACDVVGSLSSKHIRLLGLIAKLFVIRPANLPQIADQTQYDDIAIAWWSSMEQICTTIESLKPLDIDHLVGLSCVRISIGSSQLSDVLTLEVTPTQLRPTLSRFESLS